MTNITEILTQPINLNQFIDMFGHEYPLLCDFSNTPQDGEWHAEGDVHIHTQMVIDEAYCLIYNEASHLSEQDKVILILSAVFHDYAKPITTTTREIKGKERTVAPKHEGIGASLLFNLNPPLDLSPQDWLSVIQLTAYHHIPKLLILKNKAKPHYSRLARQVKSLELLYYLELADMRGRSCADKQDQIDILALFSLEAESYNLWNTDNYNELRNMVEDHFPDDNEWFHRRVIEHAKIHYEEERIFMVEEELSIAFQYKEQPHLVILCGMSGAGKSSLREKEYRNYHAIELDRIRDNMPEGRGYQGNNDEVVRIAHSELKQALRERKNILWDATNYRADFRKRIIDMGVAYGAFTEIICLQKPLKSLIQDNTNREHSVPADAFEMMLSKFQWPEVGEAHQLTILHV